MDEEKVKERCELTLDVINRFIDDLNPNEMVLAIELIVKELSNILKIYDKIFK